MSQIAIRHARYLPADIVDLEIGARLGGLRPIDRLADEWAERGFSPSIGESYTHIFAFA